MGNYRIIRSLLPPRADVGRSGIDDKLVINKAPHVLVIGYSWMDPLARYSSYKICQDMLRYISDSHRREPKRGGYSIAGITTWAEVFRELDAIFHLHGDDGARKTAIRLPTKPYSVSQFITSLRSGALTITLIGGSGDSTKGSVNDAFPA